MQDSNVNIGRNIRWLRRKEGTTLSQLAEKTGLSEKMLGRFERGTENPAAKDLYTIASSINLPVHAFFANNIQQLRLFRQQHSTKPFHVNLIEKNLPPKLEMIAQDIMDMYQALEDICGAQKKATIPLYIPFRLHDQGIVKLVTTVRDLMGIRNGIVFDYFELLETHGFRVIVISLPPNIESFTQYDPENSNAFFFLNAKLNPERQIFRLIFELGQVFFLTQHLMSPRYRQLSAQELDCKHGAKKFAAFFLLPADIIRSTVKQLGIQQKQWSTELLYRIKHRFGVSAETFLYRLKELDLIDGKLVAAIQTEIQAFYHKTGYKEPDSSRRILTPNGRLWDLVVSAKSMNEQQTELQGIEQQLRKWKILRK